MEEIQTKPDGLPRRSSNLKLQMLDFQKSAREHALAKDITIKIPEQYGFTPEEAVYLKYLFCQLVKDSIAILDEMIKEQTYVYWVTDPTLLMASRHLFRKILHVHGVQVALHPFTKAFPEPHLSAEQAPLRIICRGVYESWQLCSMEDLRELSPAQQREAIDEEDWMITIFGHHDIPAPPQESDPAETVQPSASTPAPSTPAPGTPAPSGGQNSEASTAVVPYDGVDTQPIAVRAMKPLYSVKRVLQRLPQEIEKDTVMARRLLLGLHEKMWHANAVDFANLLLRAGMPPKVVEMAHAAVASCQICRRYSRLPARPKTKVSLAAHFGDEVETDIYHLWSKTFCLLIDVATRYKVAYEVPSREMSDLLKGLLHHWIRYFGPMRVLTTDQESSLMSPAAGVEFERLGITRNPKGTTSGGWKTTYWNWRCRAPRWPHQINNAEDESRM
jgi:hypothetical protein